MDSSLVVHLDEDGEITAIQRGTSPQYLKSNIPDWVRERVACIKMLEDAKSYPELRGRKVNPLMQVLYIDKVEEKQIGNLIRKYVVG